MARSEIEQGDPILPRDQRASPLSNPVRQSQEMTEARQSKEGVLQKAKGRRKKRRATQ